MRGCEKVAPSARSGQDEQVPTVIIRSLLGRVGALMLALGAAAVLVVVLRSDGVAGLVPVLGWGGLAGVAVWALWWAPAITLSDERLRVRNAWRTHDIAWTQVVRCSTRWSLVIMLRDGSSVTAAAAQRAGGLATSWRRRQELREREMRTGRGAGGSSVAEALTHRGVREEYLSPGEGVFRTSLDADGAGDLIEAYAERRAVHERLRSHQRRRQERLARSAGRKVSDGTDGEAGHGAAGRVSPPAGSADETLVGEGLVSAVNRAPLAVVAVCLALIVTGVL